MVENLVVGVVSLTMWLLCFCRVVMSADANALELDGLLEDYGFRAFDVVRLKTGVAYDGVVPRNLTGVRVSAMRLKSGSLLSRGVRMYREFEIPKGVVTHPYVERLALLYHNLGNWSAAYYPPLHGYTYLAPVLGLVAYEYDVAAAPVTPNNSRLPRRVYIRASGQPISIHFSPRHRPRPRPRSPPNAKCVFFDVNGSVTLTDMLPDNICTTFQEGHFSVVVESIAIPQKNDDDSKIVGGVMGGVTLLVMVGMAVGWGRKYKRRRKKKKEMHSMEAAAEVGEALQMTAVGTTVAPAAVGTRTLPQLETDYVP